MKHLVHLHQSCPGTLLKRCRTPSGHGLWTSVQERLCVISHEKYNPVKGEVSSSHASRLGCTPALGVLLQEETWAQPLLSLLLLTGEFKESLIREEEKVRGTGHRD